ncbi:type I methionyl aminopeptidase [Gemmatimonadota bacterium]
MITIKSPREVETMAAAGNILATTLARVVERVEPGVSTEDLDALAEQFIRNHSGAKPSFKGLYGFPKSLCTSINNEIVHGIPSKGRVLNEGDILSIDCGVFFEGLHADAATTVAVGEISEDSGRLLEATRKALEAGIEAATLDNHVGDIGHAVQTVAEAAGFSVVRDLVGHGIGAKFHEEPQVPNFGQPKRGARLVKGMTIAIEPMVNAGGPETRTMDDNWTIVTADGSLSAHFEHTLVIGPDGPRVLTLPE